MFSWHTLGPLVPIGHRLNATAYLSIVSDHVHPYSISMVFLIILLVSLSVLH